jgi:formylglycine-generating enzyme required for sulfatase activity
MKWHLFSLLFCALLLAACGTTELTAVSVRPTTTPEPTSATPTATPIPPTSTSTPTNTPVPASDTPRPPISTSTLTNTPLPPTSTLTAIPTESPTPWPLSQTGATRVWEKDDSVMVYVPAGTFWMGSTSAEIEDAVAACVAGGGSEIPCRRSCGAEGPRHEIYLDAFWIDRTEVTNAQYHKCVEAGVCEKPTTCNWGAPTYNDDSKADHPVVCVDWNDARTYCQWAGKRLPTEAEWEKAARGTGGLSYPWGDTFDGRLVNFCDINCEFEHKNEDWDDGYADTAPVGSYADGESPYGAWDMAGNVWEWVSDWYDGNYYDVSPDSNPLGPDTGMYRVLRGGAWNRDWDRTRAAQRRDHDPSDRASIFGFRCVAVSPGE